MNNNTKGNTDENLKSWKIQSLGETNFVFALQIDFLF